MTDAEPDRTADLPHRARIWNYWLGGKDHYAADRHHADAISSALPGAADLVRATLQFGERVVQHLAAEHGIRQFIDVGSGLPVDRDLRAALRDVAPESLVVHLEHDPFVLVRARTLAVGDGVSVWRAADFRDPPAVLAAAATVLDLTQPVAVLFTGVLGYLRSPEHAAHVVHEVLSGVAPGSFLAVWDLAAGDDEPAVDRRNAITGGYDLGTVPEIEKLFRGLELVGPGVVPVTGWLPSDDGGVWDGTGRPIDAYGGVARVPAGGIPPLQQAEPGQTLPHPDPDDRSSNTTAGSPSPPGDHVTVPVLTGGPPPIVEVRSDIPVAARVWNYWLGGKDHYAADRALGDAVAATYPRIREVVAASRAFLDRTVAHLAESGIHQYLDIGCGLPTGRNTHEVAQSVLPDARVVYVDNDPQVLIHSRARLASTASLGAVTLVEADYRDPDTVLARAAATLDMRRPVAALFMGVLGHVDVPEMHRAVRSIMGALAPGSYLALWDSTDTGAEIREAAPTQAGMGIPYRLSAVAELQECFAGLDMAEPGLVPLTEWRPEPGHTARTRPVDAYGGVGRKP